MRVHPNHRHHIHSLRDCLELVRSQGHEVCLNYESSGCCYAESKTRAKGRRYTPAFFVRLYKKTGKLEVERP